MKCKRTLIKLVGESMHASCMHAVPWRIDEKAGAPKDRNLYVRAEPRIQTNRPILIVSSLQFEPLLIPRTWTCVIPIVTFVHSAPFFFSIFCSGTEELIEYTCFDVRERFYGFAVLKDNDY